MAKGKVLTFRERSKALHDALFIFPTEQLFNAQPALAVLERYGVEDPQGLVQPCIRGQLQDLVGADDEMASYAMLCVPAAHVTNELKRAFETSLRDLHVYGLEYLIVKAVYPLQLEETIGGHHIPVRIAAHQARAVYERWIADGAARTLAHHLEVSPTLAETVLERHANEPVYALYGLQTEDDEFIIEASEIEGPFRCVYRNEEIIVDPAADDW